MNSLEKDLSLATAEQEFLELGTSVHSGWFSSGRIDIIAKFKDRNDVVVDKMPLNGESLINVFQANGKRSILLETSDYEHLSLRKLPRSTLHLFTIDKEIIKRNFEFRCNYYIESAADSYPEVLIKNLSWNAVDRKISIELISNCVYVAVNSNRRIKMSKYDFQKNGRDLMGKVFVMKFDENYFLKAIDEVETDEMKDFF
jgi:hypothetical protein